MNPLSTSRRWSTLIAILATLAVSSSVARAERKGFQLASFADAGTLQTHVHYLNSLGADIVRFPIYIYEAPLQTWLSKLDAILPICQSFGIVLVVTLHSGPNPRPPVESDPSFGLWWDQISTHLRTQQRIWYDLANEPRDPNWRAIAQSVALRIRRIDTQNHIVFAPRGTTTLTATSTRPLDGIGRQIVSFHFYNWINLQKCPPTVAYPSGSYTKVNMSTLLTEVASFSARYNVPVYIGEVAICKDHPNAPRFLRDFTDFCDQLDIHLTIHAFQEDAAWRYEDNPAAWAVLTSWLAR